MNWVTLLCGRLYKNLIALPILLSGGECKQAGSSSHSCLFAFIDFFSLSLLFFFSNGRHCASCQNVVIENNTPCECVFVCVESARKQCMYVRIRMSTVDFHSLLFICCCQMSSLYKKKKFKRDPISMPWHRRSSGKSKHRHKSYWIVLLCPIASALCLKKQPVALKAGPSGPSQSIKCF